MKDCGIDLKNSLVENIDNRQSIFNVYKCVFSAKMLTMKTSYKEFKKKQDMKRLSII